MPGCAQRMRYLHTECLIGREPDPVNARASRACSRSMQRPAEAGSARPNSLSPPLCRPPSQLPRTAIRSTTEPWRRRSRQASSWPCYKALHPFVPAKLRCARLFLSFPRHHVGTCPFFGVRLSGLHTRRSRIRVSMLFCAQRRDRCSHRSLLDAEHQAPRHLRLQFGP